jgi:hypothetical protein
LINYFPLDGILRHVVIIDEAEETLLGKTGVSGINLITRYLKMFRATGTAMILTSTSWSALGQAPIIQNNCAVTVMLPMSNLTDGLQMARAQGVSPEDYDAVLGLERGNGIVKILGVDRPIFVTVPRVL